MLGLLAGVFFGVLSMKLLVPRPPAGAGADIHDEVAAATPADIVEPPALSPPVAPAVAVAETGDRYASASGFTPSGGVGPQADEPAGGTAAADEPTPTRDPFGARAQFAEPAPLAAEVAREARPLPVAEPLAATAGMPPEEHSPPVAAAAFASSATTEPVVRESYVAAAGDSWWSLAERAYGDGRLYRALFAWNRAVNPRVSLVPGTALQVPPRSRLAAAWPALIPRE